MSKIRLMVISVIITTLLVSTVIWYTFKQEKGNGSVIEDLANVKDIEILILESFPVQVHVVVYGEFLDSCTEIGKVTKTYEGSTFIVTVITHRPSDAICAQVITPFDEVIPLDALGLKKGIYTVDVNGVIDTFELQIDNMPQNFG